jgi:hypothetical protein
VIPDEDDKDMLALKDAFAEGLKRIYDAVVEALPNGSTFQRILLVLVAFSCAGALCYWVWKFSIPFFWNAPPSAGRSDDVNFGGESTSAYSGSPFVPLHQWVELYKGDMNMAADTYEDCEFWITSAVDRGGSSNRKPDDRIANACNDDLVVKNSHPPTLLSTIQYTI